MQHLNKLDVQSALLVLAFAGILGSSAGFAATTLPIIVPNAVNLVAGQAKTAGYTGDGGLASAATLSAPEGVAVDAMGNIFISDSGNSVIRRVDGITGVITTIAGGAKTVCASATDSFGNGCPATQAKLNLVASSYHGIDVAVDGRGNVYISDFNDHEVRIVDASTGMISALAGTGTSGFSGDGGSSKVAKLNYPSGLWIDAASNLYIVDSQNNRIRKIALSTGTITTFAGIGTAGYSGDGAAASAAALKAPQSITGDPFGNIFIADTGNNVVRKVTTAGNISTYAGVAGSAGYNQSAASTPTPATTIYFADPIGVASDAVGNIYIMEAKYGDLQYVDSSTGNLVRVLGVGTYTGCSTAKDTVGDGCVAGAGITSVPGSMASDSRGNIYFADAGNNLVRVLSAGLQFAAANVSIPTTQILRFHLGAADTLASVGGIAIAPGYGNFTLAAPVCAVATDTTSNCNISLTFTPTVAGQVSAPLIISTALGAQLRASLTGTGIAPAIAVDPGTISISSATLHNPAGIAFDGNGIVYVADSANHQVIAYNTASQTSTVVAGTGSAGYAGDGGSALMATLNSPQSVALDRSSNLFIADTSNNAVRRVDAVTGKISTYAGGTTAVCSSAINSLGDGCAAVAAMLNAPTGLVVDTFNTLYVSDSGNNLVRAISGLNQQIATFAGSNSGVCSAAIDGFGDGCSPLGAILKRPSGVAIDGNGNVYIADTGNNIIRTVHSGLISVFAGTGQAGFAGDGQAAILAQLNSPQSIGLDAAGDLYVADTQNDAVRLIANGKISTIAGTGGRSGSTGIPGSSAAALLNAPTGLAVSPLGSMYIADSGNNRLLTVSRTLGLVNFGSVNVGNSSLSAAASISDIGNQVLTFSAPPYTIPAPNGAFVVNNGCTQTTLLPATACNVSATFTPASAALVTEVLSLSTNAQNGAGGQISLTGTGTSLTPTVTSLTTAPPGISIVQFGQAAVLTATVAAQGTVTPIGSVTLSVNNVAQSPALLVNGTATVTLSGLSVNSYTITASYGGSSLFGSSSTAAPLNLTVTKASTTTGISATPTSILQTQVITFTAKVQNSVAGQPTGSVAFYNGSVQLGSAQLINGSATYTDTSLGIGTFSVTAAYVGDPNFSTSTSSGVSVTVAPIPPDFAITSITAPLPIVLGSSGLLALTITPQGGLTGLIAVSCANLPAQSFCNVINGPYQFSGTNAAIQVVVAIKTTALPIASAASMGLPISPIAGRSTFSGTGGLQILSVLSLVFLFMKRRTGLRIRRWTMVLLFTVASMAMISGCGNTGNANQQGLYTPTGTYAIPVTIVSGTISHTTNLTVIIQ